MSFNNAKPENVIPVTKTFDQRNRKLTSIAKSFNNKMPSKKIMLKKDQIKFTKNKSGCNTPAMHDAAC